MSAAALDSSLAVLRVDLASGVPSGTPALFELLAVDEAASSLRQALGASVHPDDRQRLRLALGAARAGGSRLDLRFRATRRDGAVRLVALEGAIGREDELEVLSATLAPLEGWRSPVRSDEIASASDADLALALRAGVPGSDGEAYRRHAGRVAAIARRVLGSPLLADDVAQDVFEAVLRRPERFDPARGDLATFLAVQARGRAIDLVRSVERRRARSARALEGVADTPDPAEEVCERHGDARVRLALFSLPERERRPIELAYYGGLSYRAVAEALLLPEGTVKSRIRSGLRRLARALAGVEAGGR